MGLAVALTFAVPFPLTAQARWLGVHLQAGTSVGSDIGVGAALTGEVGIRGTLRITARWLNWYALACAGSEDAPSECRTSPVSWEAGLTQGLGGAEKVAPFVGASFGVYRRTSRQTPEGCCTPTPTRRSSPSASLLAGFDFFVAPPIVVRLSLTHQQMFDEALERAYGGRLHFTGVLVGVGVAVR